MRFAIRDDDVNYFTNPAELEAAYGSVWHKAPPTFALISHVKGNWKMWIEEMDRYRQQMDWNAWRHDDIVYPIENNSELVRFIREKMREKKLDIAIHAIHHRNEDPVPPPERANNYIQGAEFYTTRDLTEVLGKCLLNLEKVFGQKLSVFTPPQNLLSRRGYFSVIQNDLSIVGGGLAFWKKELTPSGILNMAKVLSFKWRHKGSDYPYVLKFSRHSEAIHHYPLHPNTRIEDLIGKFMHVQRFDGDFVLSTHYHEFFRPLSYDPDRQMKDVFHEFISYIFKSPNVEYCTLSNLLYHPHQS